MGHELIRKKLIIGGLILSALCVIGLALVFIPNWNGKKENDTASGVRIYNPVQNASGISNGQNPVTIKSTAGVFNSQNPVTIKSTAGVFNSQNPVTIKSTAGVLNGKIPVTVIVNPKKTITGISNGQNPVITTRKQNILNSSKSQYRVTTTHKKNILNSSKSQYRVTTSSKKNNLNVSKSQYRINTTHKKTVSKSQYRITNTSKKTVSKSQYRITTTSKKIVSKSQYHITTTSKKTVSKSQYRITTTSKKTVSKSKYLVTTTLKQTEPSITNDQNSVKITVNTIQNDPGISIAQYSVDDNTFDFIFLQMESNKKNMIYSPISIEYALNMLKDGAVGSTFDEIKRVIGNRKISKYPNIDKVLSSGNGLFIRSSYYEYIKKDYSNTLKEKYNAEIIPDEFKNIQNVNQWMENKTIGYIKNMLSNDAVKDPKLLMIIVNGLAIDMEWENQFSFKNTNKFIFYMENGGKKKVPMMHLYGVKGKGMTYYEDYNKTVLTMNLKVYNGIQLEFMAIMPNKNLNAYVKSVSKDQINEIDKKLHLLSKNIDVSIPKFKFSYYLNLKQDLNKLGIKNAFSSDNANFSKMAIVKEMDRNLFVSDALHKTDIKFTEDGLKDAAAPVIVHLTTSKITNTTSKIKPTSIVTGKPKPIIINKPFMFIIRDKNTKDIWFTGTVYDPNL